MSKQSQVPRNLLQQRPKPVRASRDPQNGPGELSQGCPRRCWLTRPVSIPRRSRTRQAQLGVGGPRSVPRTLPPHPNHQVVPWGPPCTPGVPQSHPPEPRCPLGLQSAAAPAEPPSPDRSSRPATASRPALTCWGVPAPLVPGPAPAASPRSPRAARHRPGPGTGRGRGRGRRRPAPRPPRCGGEPAVRGLRCWGCSPRITGAGPRACAAGAPGPAQGAAAPSRPEPGSGSPRRCAYRAARSIRAGRRGRGGGPGARSGERAGSWRQNAWVRGLRVSGYFWV